MALFNNGLSGNIIGGLAVGIGASVFAPVIIPVVASVVKPLAKAAIKGGIILYERGKETIAEAKEIMEDIVAEAKAELTEPQKEDISTSSTEGKTGDCTP